jgi:hypothetical protein
VPTAPTIAPLAALQALLNGEFLSADDLDKVIDKPELLNEAYKRSSKSLIENLTIALPEIIKGEVTKAVQVNKLVTTFYEMNSDLKPYGDFVRLEMERIEKANPQKTYREIFGETAVECRKRLGLKEPTTVSAPTQQTVSGQPRELPPAFAGSPSTGGRTGSPTTNEPFDPDLDAMFRLS